MAQEEFGGGDLTSASFGLENYVRVGNGISYLSCRILETEIPGPAEAVEEEAKAVGKGPP